MKSSSQQKIHPAIQARIDFFENLEKDVIKASVGSEIRILYERFACFCANLNITQSLGNHSFFDDTCNEDFRKDLLSNIDMAKNVCLSKRDGLSLGSSLTINNTNQQKQNQNISLGIKEILRKSLTGEQYDELIDLINKKADKMTFVEKIKDFGIDVASGIIASIVGNSLSK